WRRRSGTRSLTPSECASKIFRSRQKKYFSLWRRQRQNRSARNFFRKGGVIMPKDLRTYLEQLKQSRPNHIKVVEQEIDRKWEITGLIEKMRKDPRYPEFPGVLFTNVKGSKVPALINLCASYERLALSIDATVK